MDGRGRLEGAIAVAQQQDNRATAVRDRQVGDPVMIEVGHCHAVDIGAGGIRDLGLEGAVPVAQQDADEVVIVKVADQQIGVAVQVQVGGLDIFGTHPGDEDARPVCGDGRRHHQAPVAVAVAQQYHHPVGIVAPVVVVP